MGLMFVASVVAVSAALVAWAAGAAEPRQLDDAQTEDSIFGDAAAD
jgi:hypothetical protein